MRKTKICCWHKQNSYLRAEPIGNSDGKRPDLLWSPPGISFSPPSRPPGSSAPPQGFNSTLGDGRSRWPFPAGRWLPSSRRKHRIFRNPPVRRRIPCAGDSSPAEKRSSPRCCWFRFSATLLRSFDKEEGGCKVKTRNPPPSTKDPAHPVRMGISPRGGGPPQVRGHNSATATIPIELGMGFAGPSHLSRGNTPPQDLPNPPAGPATRSGRITRIPANSLVPTPSQRAGQRRKARPGCAEGTEHGSTAEMGRRLSRKG